MPAWLILVTGLLPFSKSKTCEAPGSSTTPCIYSVINISGVSSSTVKGESLIDTVKNLEAMNPDILVVRHNCSGAPALITQFFNKPVINAGD